MRSNNQTIQLNMTRLVIIRSLGTQTPSNVKQSAVAFRFMQRILNNLFPCIYHQNQKIPFLKQICYWTPIWLNSYRPVSWYSSFTISIPHQPIINIKWSFNSLTTWNYANWFRLCLMVALSRKGLHLLSKVTRRKLITLCWPAFPHRNLWLPLDPADGLWFAKML